MSLRKREKNNIRLQVKFTAFTSSREKNNVFIHKDAISSNNSKKKKFREMVTCPKLYVTKIKYSKSLQSKRTKGEIKTSFSFTVILCKYLSKNGI